MKTMPVLECFWGHAWVFLQKAGILGFWGSFCMVAESLFCPCPLMAVFCPTWGEGQISAPRGGRGRFLPLVGGGVEK